MRSAPLSLLLVLVAAPALAAPDAGAPFETTVAEPKDTVPEGRATSAVRRGELDQRLPRSTPDALRDEPGVFIQQTAHGQASAFLRGLTGQQTVLLFDGIRLNTSTWRQGPNQYAFTLDAASLAGLEVLRGGGSTRFGSDALGGVIAAQPLEASRADGFRPTLTLRGATADRAHGGRFAFEAVAGPVAFIGGVGLREVGLLESAGPVRGLAEGRPVALVPRFAPDGRTQLGTGFKELTGDGRLTWRPGARDELVLGAQLYRQFDAPRTDQCPPPGARSDECLTYREQLRSLASLGWTTRPAALESVRATLSWQRQHEDREGARPASFVLNTGRDTVDTLGARAVARAHAVALGPAALRLEGGVDSYLDLVQSSASVGFTDLGLTRALSRGQYVAGSTSLTGGAFVEGHLALGARLHARAGGRLGWASLVAPGDEASGTAPVRGLWWPLAGHAGLEWRAAGPLSLLASADHSFRAPNLDDLTSRQQTGPGFQFENPALAPERATTVEAGLRVRSAGLTAEAWAFQTWLSGAVGKQPRDIGDCPPGTPQCAASWFRFQLVNAPGVADLRGGEVTARARLPLGFGLRAAASYVWGEGPSLGDGATRVPLSRVPPPHGFVEASWRLDERLGGAAVLRWAGEQRRLAMADLSDPRIPPGGTPGFALVDLRAWVRVKGLFVSLVLENLFDTAWRAHGSSVNGPGRGVLLSVGVGPPGGGGQGPGR